MGRLWTVQYISAECHEQLLFSAVVSGDVSKSKEHLVQAVLPFCTCCFRPSLSHLFVISRVLNKP